MTLPRLLEGPDLTGALEQAAALIARAYPAGSARMDGSFLAWALSGRDPGARPLAASLEGRGFAAAIPVTLALGDSTVSAHVVTAVAVAPEARGSGLGASLYATLLRGLVDAVGDPVVLTFAQASSAGAHLIARSYPACGWHGTQLFARPVWGTLRHRLRPLQDDSSVVAFGEEEVLAPDPATIAWLLRDPRALGAATPRARAALLPVIGDDGPGVGTVDLLAPVDSTREVLEALESGVALLPESVRQVVVTSLDVTRDDIASAVGLRRLPSPEWSSWIWCARNDHPALRARSSTMPVT